MTLSLCGGAVPRLHGAGTRLTMRTERESRLQATETRKTPIPGAYSPSGGRAPGRLGCIKPDFKSIGQRRPKTHTWEIPRVTETIPHHHYYHS